MLERLFQLRERNTDVRTEIIAGITTFLTAAYIVFVNPAILSQTGMDKAALTTVTCVVAGLATLLMALWANAPLMMAPGMGLNAFFTYSLVIGQKVPWQTALGVVFISGALFLVLTWFGLRERLARAIPTTLRIAASVGIGLFIAFIGLQNLGLIVKNDAVLVQLGQFTMPALFGLGGLLLMLVLELHKVKGSILISILATALVGMVAGLTPFPDGLVNVPPSPAPIAFKLDILGAFKLAMWANIFSFMFVDLFDSLGTLLAVCREAGLTDEKGEVHNLSRMLQADAVATVGGALLGTSTTTTYIESASGVSEGGKTGLTAAVTAILFLLAAFFTPVIGAVPAYATAPALILVGIFMMRGIGQLDFYNFEEGAPAFLTFVMMPLTYSIATGLAFGFISYVLLKLLSGKGREVDVLMYGAAIFSVASFCL